MEGDVVVLLLKQTSRRTDIAHSTTPACIVVGQKATATRQLSRTRVTFLARFTSCCQLNK